MALAARPGYLDAHHNLGRALARQGLLGQSIGSFDRVISARGGYAEAHYHKGKTLVQLGRTRKAIKAFAEALRHRQNYVDAHFNRRKALVPVENHPLAAAQFHTPRMIPLSAPHLSQYLARPTI